MAFSRAMRTETPSMSLPTAMRLLVRAAAMASTPVPGTDVEHARKAPRLQEAVEGDQAADGGAVVAGAERRAGLDPRPTALAGIRPRSCAP